MEGDLVYLKSIDLSINHYFKNDVHSNIYTGVLIKQLGIIF